METDLRLFGPMPESHPSIGDLCGACKQPFKVGCFTTLIALGPGDDEGAQERAREGRPYNAVAILVHFSCATGKEGTDGN
jgi:hypothetical protein